MKMLAGSVLVVSLLTTLAAPARERASQTQRLKEVRAGVARTLEELQQRLANPQAAVTRRDLPNAALFVLSDQRNPRDAEKLLRTLFAAQDSDPQSLRYGSFPWTLGDNRIQDDNADTFCPQALGPILLLYGDQLSPQFKKEIGPHLGAALAALRRRQLRTPAYTNIFLMRAVNLILLGEATAAAGWRANGIKLTTPMPRRQESGRFRGTLISPARDVLISRKNAFLIAPAFFATAASVTVLTLC